MTTLTFDPTGTAPSNLVSNELHSPIFNPAVFPLQGCFYTNNLVVRGVDIVTNITTQLTYLIDFIYSPRFTSRSASTGRDVYSYILVLDKSKWASISLTYHGVGGDQDNVLLAQVSALSDSDKRTLSNWLALPGDGDTIINAGGMPSPEDSLYILAAKLDEISNTLQQPTTLTDYLKNQLVGFNTNLSDIQTKYTSFQTKVNGSGLFDGIFLTQNNLTAQLGTTLTSYYTKNDVSHLLSDNVTINKTYIDTKLSTEFYNQTSINNILGMYTNTTDMNHQINVNMNSGVLSSKHYTDTQLIQYYDKTTIDTTLESYVLNTALGVGNGVATLDATGRLPAAQLPSSVVGAVVYQGTWDASTNTPNLPSAAGVKGQYYKVSVAGTTNVGGIAEWYAGDTVISNGTKWDKIDGVTYEVTSIVSEDNNILITKSAGGAVHVNFNDGITIAGNFNCDRIFTGNQGIGGSFVNVGYNTGASGVANQPVINMGNKTYATSPTISAWSSGHNVVDASIKFSGGTPTSFEGDVTITAGSLKCVAALMVSGDIACNNTISAGTTLSGSVVTSTTSITAGTTITATGAITAGGDLTAFSDIRLKTNVKPIKNSLDTINRLQGFTYTKDDKKSIGFIAQYVNEVLPELVYVGDDDNKTLSLAYGNITAVLNEGIKDLHNLLIVQQSYIASLEERLIALENKI